jgi:hypothetical protein
MHDLHATTGQARYGERSIGCHWLLLSRAWW